MNKYLKWTLRILGGFLLLLVVAFIVLKIYVGTHKHELITDATNKISEKIGGKIEIKDIGTSLFKNFPYLTISLDGLKITDSLYAQHSHALLAAESISVRINPLKMLMLKIAINKFQIEKGGFYIYTDTTGYTNGYLLKGQGEKKPPAPKKEFENILDNISVKDFRVTINDLQKKKLFDFTINEFLVKTNQVDSIVALKTKSNILINSFAFKTTKGSFVENHLFEGNWDLKFNTKTPALLFDSMVINISKQPFLFKGGLHFGEQQTFDLDITTQQIKLDFAKSLLTKKIAKGISIADVSTPLDVHTVIIGSLVGGGDPYIKAEFTTKGAAVKTPFMTVDSASFNGYYMNEVVKGQERNDLNSKVVVTDFNARFKGLPIHSDDILIINLTHPLLSTDLQSNFSLYGMDEFLATDAFTLSNGEGLMDLFYEGPIQNITPKNATIKGNITLKNGTIQLHGSNAVLSNCNAKIKINNADLILDTIQCNIAGNPITIAGEAKNVLALIGEVPDGVTMNLRINAPIININDLSKIVSRKFPVKKIKVKKSSGSLAKTAANIDKLLSNGKISVSVKAGTLKYKTFEANNLVARMKIDDQSWALEKAALKHGKGTFEVNATVKETSKKHFLLNTNVEMKNVDAERVMREFQNFGLKTPTYKNIKGTLNLSSNVSLNMTPSGDFDISTLSGKTTFSIKDGALVDFDPIQNISFFLFKNRNMSHVQFAEIKDDIDFNKGIIKINRMEINSNVLKLYIEGYHSQNETDFSIQVPMSNLKNKDKDYKPENTGAGKGGGMSIFIRAKTDDKGKIKISYDPFARFKKSPTEKTAKAAKK